MADKLSKSEFKKSLKEYAAQFKLQIESMNDGFDISPAACQTRRKRAFNDFEFFSRTYFPHYIRQKEDEKTGKMRDVEPALFHKWCYENLPRIVKLKTSVSQVIAASRGEAKSTYIMIFTIYCICYGLKHYILFIQDVYEQAAIMIESIKAELEFNQRLKADFPDIFGKSDIWKEGVFVTRNNIKVHARGAGQKIRGLKHGAYRPDLVALDDIENDELVENPKNRDKLQNWLNKAVKNLGEARAKFDVIYIGTILHYDSVLARTINNPMWNHIVFKAIMQWPENKPLWDEWEETLRNLGHSAADAFYQKHKTAMDKGAVLSWPDKRNLQYLMEKRIEVGHSAFDAEYQNDPLSGEDATFTNFTFWNVLSEPLVMYGAVDPSLGKAGKTRDPSAILIGGYNRHVGHLKLFEAAIKKRLPDKIIADMIYYQKKYNCVMWFVETVQFQEFLRTEAIRRGQAEGVLLNCIAVQQNVDKDLRIQSLQPHVNDGTIEFHPSLTALVQQMKHWPKVDHDDGVDCLHTLWSNVVKYGGGGQTVIKTLEDFRGTSLFNHGLRIGRMNIFEGV